MNKPNHTYRPIAVSSLFTAHHSQAENYAFASKERDTETGLSYFGARYYSSELSIWLSVDPMVDKYPSFSPYVYCANNPIKLVDPNGEEIRIHYGNKSIKYTPGMKVKKRYDAFTKDAITGLNFLFEHPEGNKNRIAHLAKSEIVLDVYQQKAEGQSSKYNGEKRELKWDNTHTDIFEDGAQSPIVGLAHEIDHADRSISAWENYYDCQENITGDCDQYVDQMYSRDNTDAEESAMKYENFIGGFSVNGKPVSTKQRSEYIAPKSQIKVNSIFSLE